jgi:hypothetical protein
MAIPLTQVIQLPSSVNIPEQVLGLPLVDLKVRARLRNEVKQVMGCGVAAFGNEHQLFQRVLGFVGGASVGLGVLATAVNGLIGSQQSQMRHLTKIVPEVNVVLGMVQVIALSGQLRLNYPVFYSEFTGAFAWSLFIIPSPQNWFSGPPSGPVLSLNQGFSQEQPLQEGESSTTSLTENGFEKQLGLMGIKPQEVFVNSIIAFGMAWGTLVVMFSLFRILLACVVSPNSFTFYSFRHYFVDHMIGKVFALHWCVDSF